MALRAIAVLAVIGFHAFPNWIGGGFIGVDVFFVISGYLISALLFNELDQKNFSFIRFYSRRIRRIFPALAVVLLSAFAFGWFVMLTDEYRQLGKHIAGGAGFVSNLLLWQESGYFDSAAELKPLLHLWSLGIEEQFYIVWPLLLALILKLRLRPLLIIGLLTGISFFLNIYGINNDPIATFYSPQTRFWELSIGAILAYLKYRPSPLIDDCISKLESLLARLIFVGRRRMWAEASNSSLSSCTSLLGLALIAFGVMYLTSATKYPGYWALLPTLGAVCLICAGSDAWINRVFLSNRLMVWVGLISYPLYLWHWLLLSYARIIGGAIPPINYRILLVLTSFLLAWLTYILLEKPIRLGRHQRAKTIAVLVLIIATGYIGLNTLQRDGLPFRYPKEVRNLTSYVKYDWEKDVRDGECFLDSGKKTDINEKCYSDNSIVLWGDSYAASLYPGLYKWGLDHNEKISQFTVAGCPPIFNLNENFFQRNCNEANQKIISQIRKISPKVLIIHSQWITKEFG